MKIFFTLFLLSLYSLVSAQTIVQWNFSDSNPIADGGIMSNLSSTITTTSTGTISYPGTASGTMTNPPYILNTGWSNGANWEMTFSTLGYSNLTLSFKQRSSGTGPRDWTILTNGSSISSYALAGTTGQTFGPIALGTGANNSSSVTISFQVNSSTNVNGTAIAGTGTSGLDDILITGTSLPVTFSNFIAEADGKSSAMYFSTASESNNDYFTIERSSDNNYFKPIGEIKGAGNSNKEIQYKFIDDAPITGNNYYRIKQTDFDGHYSYSNIKSVRHMDISHLNISPLYTNGMINITTDMENYDLAIYNTSGQEVQQFEAMSGNQQINIETLKMGIYFIQLTSDHKNQTVKVFKN